MKKLLALFIFCTIIISNIQAAHWLYISPTGNDGNTGTKEHPLASLTGARDRLRQLREQNQLTDTVYIYVLPGEYYLSEPLILSQEDGGTAQCPVIFTADAVSRPVFYGGIKLGKFEAVSENLWRVFIPEAARYGFHFEQLYINGQRRFRAQTPNRGEFYMVKSVEEIPVDKAGNGTPLFASQKIKLQSENFQLLSDLSREVTEDILVTFHQKWSEARRYIQHISKPDTAFYITGSGMAPWNPIDSITRYYAENYRGALDAPGEWFLAGDGYLYYIPQEGETIENTECIAPVLKQFLILSGNEKTGKRIENVRFENLSFRVSGYKTPVFGNEPGQAAADIDATVLVDFAKRIKFYNCELANTGVYAIWFRRTCSESLVEHCRLYDLGAGGIRIGDIQIRPDSTELTHRITVNNNIIQHGGYVFPDGVGVIIFQGSDNIITHNDIADFRYSGISVGWVWGYANSPSKRNKIAFNHIHHLGWGELSDMGGVYTLGASEGTVVNNNVIHDIYSFDYGARGLYTDEGSTGVVMENNLVYHCKDDGFHQHFGKENIIRNNIFAFNILSQIGLSRPEAHLSFSFVQNIVYSDKGVFFSDTYVKNSWIKANTHLDFNCYWDLRTPHPVFYGTSFSEWQKAGKDPHSIIADPLFVDPQNLNFHFKSMKVAKKIGFMPFDYEKAGVYGDENWKNLAKLDPSLIKSFDEAVVKNSYKGQ